MQESIKEYQKIGWNQALQGYLIISWIASLNREHTKLLAQAGPKAVLGQASHPRQMEPPPTDVRDHSYKILHKNIESSSCTVNLR